MNPYLLGLVPVGLAFAGLAWWRRRAEAELGAMGLAWFVSTYVPFYLASMLGQRVTYLFYFLPTLPAVALAGSAFLLKTGLARPVLWIYLAAVLVGFYSFFPFKLVP
jgi:dolichyl-phosphate-mannose--protein O-mannosyl transferase